MLRKLALFVTGVFVVSSAVADDKPAKRLDNYRCVSNGLRLATSWRGASQPRIFSRYRRKAMVDLKGKLKLVFPTFYMARIKPVKAIREYPFPNDVQIQAGIEPSFKMSNNNLDTSPRIVGNTVTYRKGDKETYKIITVDLGDKVIKKGEWFGIWVVCENLDLKKKIPVSRGIGSSKEQIYECSYTSYNSSFIKDDFIRTAKKLPLIKRNYIVGFSPVAILAETDYKGDVWAIVGSSSPEGWYDIRGDQYGDKNGNAGYADKLCSTVLACPSVNLSKGSDSFTYCVEEFKARLDILNLCNVNKVHVYLASNDLKRPNNIETFKRNSKKLVEMIKKDNPNASFIGTTILPRSRSKDKFKTVENQKAKPYTAGASSLRGKWNALMRENPGAAGYSDAFELCSFVEYDWEKGTGLWAAKDATPKKYTVDGTHPTCAGSTVIAENAYLIHSK